MYFRFSESEKGEEKSEEGDKKGQGKQERELKENEAKKSTEALLSLALYLHSIIYTVTVKCYTSLTAAHFFPRVLLVEVCSA